MPDAFDGGENKTATVSAMHQLGAPTEPHKRARQGAPPGVHEEIKTPSSTQTQALLVADLVHTSHCEHHTQRAETQVPPTPLLCPHHVIFLATRTSTPPTPSHPLAQTPRARSKWTASRPKKLARPWKSSASPTVADNALSNAKPTSGEARREAKQKRVGSTGPDKDADRASQIHSIVRHADNCHLQHVMLDMDLLPTAQSHPDFHVHFWKAETGPSMVKTLLSGAVKPMGLTLDEILAFNKNGKAWLDILQTAVNTPLAPIGYSCIVQVLNWRYNLNKLANVRADVETVLRRFCKMPCITVFALQPIDNSSKPSFSPPQHPLHAFLVQKILYECTNTICVRYAMHISWPENKAGISISALPPDLAPPTHIGTYDNLRDFPAFTPDIRACILAAISEHFAKRWPETKKFIRPNKTRLWGGGSSTIEPWSLDLVQASLSMHVWEVKTRDERVTETTITIYFLVVFDTNWLHKIFEATLLGRTAPRGGGRGESGGPPSGPLPYGHYPSPHINPNEEYDYSTPYGRGY